MHRSTPLSLPPSEHPICDLYQLPTLRALAAVIDARDYATHAHSTSVVYLATRIAKELHLPAYAIDQLGAAALLHDIGKVGVCDAILLKPGPLTGDELAHMREHPAIGARIVAPVLPDLAPIIRAHHEWWNGCGYPDGLVGEAIPLLARIIAVADAFDSMTTDRPYRSALSMSAALDRLRAGSGIQFEPRIVDIVVRLATTQES